MRNTTKLKAILQVYHAEFSMEDSATIYMTLVDKETNEFETFSNKSYTLLINTAYTKGYKKWQKVNQHNLDNE